MGWQYQLYFQYEELRNRMAKIDLTGNSGWQSKSSDLSKEILNGDYHQTEIILKIEEQNVDWIEEGTFAQLLSDELILIIDGERSEYQKNDIIYLEEIKKTEITLEYSQEIKLMLYALEK